MSETTKPVDRRCDFVFLFDVTDGNPNGDPDSGNMPRVDPQTRQGLVTDVCMKRKIRNAMFVLGEGRPGYEIYFQTQDASTRAEFSTSSISALTTRSGLNSRSRTRKRRRLIAIPGPRRTTPARRGTGCASNFFDVRAFGAVMTTGVNCGQVRGPVQITFSRSIDPVLPLDFAITRKSVTTVEEAQKQAAGDGSITGTIGRKDNIPYGLFRCSGFINPLPRQANGFQFRGPGHAVAVAQGADVGDRSLGQPRSRCAPAAFTSSNMTRRWAALRRTSCSIVSRSSPWAMASPREPLRSTVTVFM